MKMKLSIQGQKAVMMAVQKGLLATAQGKSKEECDISGMLAEFVFEQNGDQLFVLNPPIVEFDMFNTTDEPKEVN